MQISQISNKQSLQKQLNIPELTGLSERQIKKEKQGIELWVKLIQIIINNQDDVGSFSSFLPRKITLGYDFNVWPPYKPLLIHACEYNRTQIVDYLIKDLQFDINVINPEDGYSPVHYACYYGQPQFLIFLLEENAQYDQCNFSEELPQFVIQNQLKMLKKQLVKATYENNILISEENLLKCQEIIMQKIKENE